MHHRRGPAQSGAGLRDGGLNCDELANTSLLGGAGANMRMDVRATGRMGGWVCGLAGWQGGSELGSRRVGVGVAGAPFLPASSDVRMIPNEM